MSPSAWAADAIPFKHAETVTDPSLGHIMLALIVCVAVLAAFLWLLRRRIGMPGKTTPETVLKVVQYVRVAPKLAFTVVQFGGKTHLLAHTDQSVAPIDTLPAASSPQEDHK